MLYELYLKNKPSRRSTHKSCRITGNLVIPGLTRGDGRIFLRSRIWWIAYSRNGREYRESSCSTDEKTAQKMLEKIFLDLLEPPVGFEPTTC